jgi:protein phosphatase
LTTDDSYLSGEAPEGSSCKIEINSGECILVCTDEIHDLVPSHEWQPISVETYLQRWIVNLKNQVYESKGNAYDNSTTILVYFD